MNTNINFKEYELVGGSAKIPEGLKINEKDIVFNDDDIIITRHMASYYWWENKNTSEDPILLYCKATGLISDFKLKDKGYPLSDLKKEIDILKGLKSLEDVKLFKKTRAAEIKWHDILWTTHNYDNHDDRVVWKPIPIKDGAPMRAPKYVSRDAYWEWGQKYSVEENIE